MCFLSAAFSNLKEFSRTFIRELRDAAVSLGQREQVELEVHKQGKLSVTPEVGWTTTREVDGCDGGLVGSSFGGVEHLSQSKGF